MRITLDVNLTGDAISTLLANSASIVKGIRIMSAELDALKAQVAALVAAEEAAVANSDKLHTAINVNTSVTAGLQAQIVELTAKVTAGGSASAADLTAITDQLAAATQTLVDSTVRDAAAVVVPPVVAATPVP